MELVFLGCGSLVRLELPTQKNNKNQETNVVEEEMQFISWKCLK